MELCGYVRSDVGDDESMFVSLREVSIVTSDLAELRSVVAFLSEAIAQLDARRDVGSPDEAYTGLATDWHVHYRDTVGTWSEEASDLIVIRPRA